MLVQQLLTYRAFNQCIIFLIKQLTALSADHFPALKLKQIWIVYVICAFTHVALSYLIHVLYLATI